MNKRKNYLLYTSIAFSIGSIIYGILGFIAHDFLDYPFNPTIGFLLYGFMGGLLIGGLLSGILLFTRIIKTQRQTLKILSIALFPITFFVIALGGIITFVPYWVYNLFQLRKEKVKKI